jgi:metal-responsive CopG/Arc/MetJ family transcriptional regulator
VKGLGKAKKSKISITIDRDLLKKIDELAKKRFKIRLTRSAIIEYYLRLGIEADKYDISVTR